VGVSVLRLPQEWLKGILLSAFALLLYACLGVGYANFSTSPTWIHAGLTKLWMWKNMSIEFISTKTRERKQGKPRQPKNRK